MHHRSLLKKYLDGDCSQEELKELYTYLQQGELSDYEDIMDDIWEQLQDAPQLSPEKSEQVFARIQSDIEHTSPRTVPIYQRWPVYGAAAAIAILLAAAVIFINLPNMVEVSTAYQETKSLTLPDGTQVTLNSNSSVRYSENILNQATRQIWIQGEVYFDVESITQKEESKKVPFIVHTEVVDIRVLGTQFNVKDRHGKTEVVLTEGKIRLTQAQNPAKELDMEPGQKVLADAQTGLKLINVEDPALYASWKENELYFDDQPLADIAQDIGDEYGIEIIIADSDLGNLQFTGSAPADQLEVLLISIEKSFNLNIKKDENRYIIEKAAQP